VERVERSVEVDCPIRTVYSQWTQFEEFPRFMSGVKEVLQIDDTHMHWRAEVLGKDKEWDAEITEQIPDQRISWRSTSGDENAGTVRFEPLPGNRTLVRLALGFEPKGALENTGEALGTFTSHVENTMKGFKVYIEERQLADGAWRSEIHGDRASDRRPTDTPRRNGQ
jgi:uncharacterized membrane protein